MSFTTKLLDILSINATAAKDYIDKLLETKQNKLTFDDAPKKGSTNPVTSDGIRKAIDTATPNVDFSNYPTKNGTGATGTWPISISGAATKASQDSNGKVITDTYLKKMGDTATGDITAPNFIGHLKGNADTATKATQDADGNAIADTYLKKSGGTMTGEIIFSNEKGIASANGNALIEFFDDSQAAIIIRTSNGAPIYFAGDSSFSYIDTSAGAFHGDVVGTATKAKQDASGNVIADTYATKTELSGKQDKLIFDTNPTANSTNPVTSDGIKKAIDAKTVDLSGYQTKLTFDSTPTVNSTNPITSGGVKTYVDNALASLIDGDTKSY